jgi:hypothetical protein
MLRDNLLEACIGSVLKYKPKDSVILIGDQGLRTIDIKKKEHYENLGCYFYTLKFDCGLSAARNHLVKCAKDMGCDYSLIMSESMVFNEKTQGIEKLYPYLESGEFDLIGLKLNNADIYWTGWISLKKHENFVLDFTDRQKPPDVGPIYKCSIVHNFFLAKTESLFKVKWDDNLKLAEHEDFFYRYMLQGFTCGWTRDISCDRFKTRDGAAGLYRQENWIKGLQTLKLKYGLKNWITYINRNNGFYEGTKWCLPT